MIRIRNGNEGCQMKNHVATLHCLLDPVGITDIPRKDIEIFLNLRLRMVEPSP